MVYASRKLKTSRIKIRAQGEETRMVITIDGPAGAGKSTVSRELAKKLSFFYLDTGALYRALAYRLRALGVSHKNHEEQVKVLSLVRVELFTQDQALRVRVDGEEIEDKIRTEEIGALASQISMIREVREKLLPVQRSAAKLGNIVAEGRDMGTVVFPDAEFKFFLEASLEVRAMRRYRELLSTGEKKVELETIRKSIVGRDEQDMARSIAPLKPHPDAVIIDTSDMSVQEIVERIVKWVRERQS